MENPHDRSSYWARLRASSLLIGGLLALLGMNLSTVTPTWDIDSAFRVGLTHAVVNNLRFGIDVIWPYGPLGFLGGPTMIDRGPLLIAILYQFVALAILFSVLLLRFKRLGLGRGWAVAILVPFALAISITDNIVPEVVTVTVLLVLLTLWHEDPPGMVSSTTWRVLVICGFVAGAQVLVKFGPGVVACAVVMWFAVASPQRLRRVPAALAAVAAGFLAVWFGTGQGAAALLPYFHTSLELSSGYQEAQAWGPYGGRASLVGLMTIIAAAGGVFGAYRWERIDRRAWLVLVPLVLVAWFTLKQGLVRWDAWHVNGALLIVGLLVLSMRWEKRAVAVPIGVLIVGALVAFAQEPARLKSTWSDRTAAALAVLSSNRQAQDLDAARAEVRASLGVPAQIVEALRGGSVHAEQWDINALWANDLDWSPLPVLQSYSTYTADLDRINAARYASSAAGPDGVLLSSYTVDSRYAVWESPDARVALTCNFVAIVESGNWTALRRAPDLCGSARQLGAVTVSATGTIDVPQPSRADSLVVARFDLPSDAIGKLFTTFLRPIRYAQVTIDGESYRLVRGTAQNAHLVRSPGKIGARDLPHGRVEHSTLSFRNVGPGTITVHFEEIPLGRQDSEPGSWRQVYRQPRSSWR